MSRFDDEAMQYRKEHGFWPPWHVEFYRTEPMLSVYNHHRHKLVNSANRLARLRQLNAPDSIVANELALQAQCLFRMAATCNTPHDLYERCTKQAWKRAQQALAMGWHYEPPPKVDDDGGDDDDA